MICHCAPSSPSPVVPAGAHCLPVVSTEAYPYTVISTERSEWRNPTADGDRPKAGACGVGGASIGSHPFGFAQSPS